ncbi:MAG: hypothetical protein AUK55_09910 [Syntrophobacteraceae bacterium CG2_30_61_12]|nr:MAG: hypothetical protein AUK55_09910 [Syntrophobacteraceae bacterium CG2_30_61_12]
MCLTSPERILPRLKPVLAILLWIALNAAVATEIKAEDPAPPGSAAGTQTTDQEAASSGVGIPGPIPRSNAPTEPTTSREKLREALLNENFRYDPQVLIDPFVPFTVKEDLAAPEFQLPTKESEVEPPKAQLPLTRLQKMGLGEVESGLKAILMGPLGRRALIQDGAGKGYIVVIGTPVTGNDGVVTEIFEDAIVIRQQVWDRGSKKYVPKETLISLKTEAKAAAAR